MTSLPLASATAPQGGDQPDSARMRILVIEDDEATAAYMVKGLTENGYVVDRVGTGRDGLFHATSGHFDLIIVDRMLPELDGLAVVKALRAAKLVTPVLFLSALGQVDDRVSGLKAGADDYLTKPFDRSELQARLRACTRILTLQDDQIQAQEQLRFQATHDPLTGIWNRGAILETLHRELGRAARSESAVGILLLDLDHFKTVNDTHGHLAGDGVLREVTQRMIKAARAYDSVGRYGGEEFLIVLPGCSRGQIQQSGERIRSAVDSGPILVNGSEVPVTVSIGAAVAARGTTSETEMLAAADAALYRAKEIGRNRIIVSDLVFN
jgi:two-component system cell cycle response regulator